MDLWIRSQDKMKLVNNCNLYISNEIRNEYVIEDLSNKYLKLGTYQTKERALEVLDEIQSHLNTMLSINIAPPEYVKTIVNFVYEMPLE